MTAKFFLLPKIFFSSFEIVSRIRLFSPDCRHLPFVELVNRLLLRKEIIEHFSPISLVHLGYEHCRLSPTAHAHVHFRSISRFDRLDPYLLNAVAADRGLHFLPLVQLFSLPLRGRYIHCPNCSISALFVDNVIFQFGPEHTQLTVLFFAISGQPLPFYWRLHELIEVRPLTFRRG